MKNIENFETKEVECLKCGWVGKVAKYIPLRLAWCGGCRSSRLRIYHAPNKVLHTDAAKPTITEEDLQILEQCFPYVRDR